MASWISQNDTADGTNDYKTLKNIGIGTESPISLLQVNQPTTGCGLVTTNSTTTLTGTSTQFLNTFKVGDTINVSGETERIIASISSDTSLTVTVAFSTSQSNLTYTVSGGTRLAVKGNGNIGIGTASPLVNLHNNGDFITKGPWHDVRAYINSLVWKCGSNAGVASGSTLTETGMFINVLDTDTLFILSGPYMGKYDSTGRTDDSVTVAESLTADTGVSWEVIQGTVADQSDDIQAAINSSKYLLFPHGVYYIAKTLTLHGAMTVAGGGCARIMVNIPDKTGTATFSQDDDTVTISSGTAPEVGDYIKADDDDDGCLGKVIGVSGSEVTLAAGYSGTHSGAYTVISPAIKNSGWNAHIKNLYIWSLKDKKHVGIDFYQTAYSSIDVVGIKNMYIGIYLSQADNIIKQPSISSCRTGMLIATDTDWSCANSIFGGEIADSTKYGVRFRWGLCNTFYGTTIQNNSVDGIVAAVSMETDYLDRGGANSLVGCHLEWNRPGLIRIASKNNRILNCTFGQGFAEEYIIWENGSDSASSGNIFWGNWFAGINDLARKEIVLSNVAIGKSAPEAKLTVQSDIESGADKIITASGGSATVSAFQNEVTHTIHTSGLSTTVTTTDEAFLGINTRMRITANGETRNVVNKLDDNTIIVDEAVDWDDEETWYYQYPIFDNLSPGVQLIANSETRTISAKTDAFTVTVNASVDWYGSGNGVAWEYKLPLLNLRDETSQKLFVTPDGNIGVGTASPENILTVNRSATTPATPSTYHCAVHISGAPYLTLGADTSNAYIQSWSVPLYLNSQGNNVITGSNLIVGGSEIFFNDNGQIRSYDNAHRILFRRGEGKLELRENGDIIFSPGSWGDETAKMVAKSNGNVGIGTTSPERQLTIDHSSDPTFGLYTSGTERVTLRTDTSSNLRIETAGSERVRIDGSGNVGIGTTSPSKRLEISKASGSSAQIDLLDLNSCDTGVGAGSKIRFRTSDNSNTLARFGVIDEDGYGGGFQFEINKEGSASDTTTEVVRINKNGNVGIGTTSPTSGTKLDVNGNIKVSGNSNTLILPASSAAPNPLVDGMIAYADGTNWNPGSGKGIYAYYNSTWNKL